MVLCLGTGSCTTRAPRRKVIRALGQRATARSIGRLCHRRLPSFRFGLLKRVDDGKLLFVGVLQLLHNIFNSATPPST
jgi:hypothetical protein